MWILKHLGAGGEFHYLLPGKEYVVGRKNCDILLSRDQSVSRVHAHLIATDQTLTVKDTSKYGTFVNHQRLSENTSLSLGEGDQVTFGVFQSDFSVDKMQLLVCSSCVDDEGKARLSQALLPLGGKLVNSWTEDCTHLVMPTVKVTIKTISALLCCRPIIKQELIGELSRAVRQKRTAPEADSFIPELDEPRLNGEEVDLTVRPERQRLFVGRTFVFLSDKQLKRLSATVGYGGGWSQLLAEGSLPRPLLQSPQSCVVDVATRNSQASIIPSSTMDWANSVGRILQEKGLRLIAEFEIGLAAVYISCDKYCNPTHTMTDTVGVSDTGQSAKSRIPVAPHSQNAAEETVLPVASLNITAYAENTKPSQGICWDQHEVTGVGETPDPHSQSAVEDTLLPGVSLNITTYAINTEPSQGIILDQHEVMAVGETPEKRHIGSSVIMVAETISSSISPTQKTTSHGKQTDSQPHQGVVTAGAADLTVHPVPSKATSFETMFSQKQSPLKQKPSTVSSPQKRSSLASFFQPLNKKRPREDDSSPVGLESKRAMPPTTGSRHTSSNTQPDSFLNSRDLGHQASGTEFFPGQSPTGSYPDQGKKRKEMEAGIELEELEFMTSEDIDDFDDQQPYQQVQPAECNKTQPDALVKREHHSTNQKEALSAGKLSSKRLRLDVEVSGLANQLPNTEVEELSVSNRNQSLETEEGSSSNGRPQPVEDEASDQKFSRRECWQAAKEEEVSPVVHSEEGNGVFGQQKASETPLKPTKVKLETPVSGEDEGLPQAGLLIEFRTLAVKPQHFQGNGSTTNFKRFHKVPVPGAKGRPSMIGASDLVVYNRSSNAELDEWLRDVAEEEQWNSNEETLGDDLFRYNASKVTRRT